MTFREAHHCVGQAVRHAFSQGRELHELSLSELQSFTQLIKDDIFNCLDTRETINRRTCSGGTARCEVLAAIQAAEKRLA
jgi:argininosuccinate lyase